MPAPSVRALDADTLVWQAYSEEVKVDLSSTAIHTIDGWVLFDPIAFDRTSLDSVTRGIRLSAIVLTNANHQRDSLELRKQFQIPIFAHMATKPEVEADHWLPDDAVLWEHWNVCPLPGFGLGEIALHNPSGAGTLIFGDAIINLPTHPFVPLPAKYCTDPTLATQSLQNLDVSAERCLFAHGDPVLFGGDTRLQRLTHREATSSSTKS